MLQVFAIILSSNGMSVVIMFGIGIIFQFEYYQKNKDSLERHTLEDFSLSATSHRPGSVKSDMALLHSLVVPDFGSQGESSGKISILGNSVVSLMANGIKVGHSVNQKDSVTSVKSMNFRKKLKFHRHSSYKHKASI